ncbi:MAG: hypothetical protein WCC29_08850, partial [Pseudomonas farsensis]
MLDERKKENGMMTANRPLHLHTLDSLCADLIAGVPVSVGDDGSTFQLKSNASRGVLRWYTKNKTRW